ncbi:MAG: heavy-metal-associated domain-containing protein [Tannerellaceae bacterium]|jgi:copper chaperone CopZ|nr:heavy-metal-associated domain-containing protein [Tannerellaceae bacterium]
MKRVILVMMCALCAFSFTYAQDAKEKKNNKKTVTFAIEGMHCADCVKKIEKNIAFEKGVTDLKCDLPTKKAEVTYRADKTTEDKIAAAFQKIGMEATAVKGESK